MTFIPTSTLGVVANNELWVPPTSPNVENDEFDSDTLDPAWVGENATGTSAAAFDVDGVDTYDTSAFSGDPIRYTLGVRKSWLLVQADPGNIHYIQKPYTFPTNVLILARFKFNIKISILNNDADVGLVVGATSGGFLNRSVSGEMFLNEADSGTTQADLNVDGSTVRATTSTSRAGSPLEYAAIHKIGSTFHHWVGTSTGNWVYMGSDVPGATYDRVGLVFINTNSAAAPGTPVVAVDFIRFFEGETNFLL